MFNILLIKTFQKILKMFYIAGNCTRKERFCWSI